MVMNSHAEPMLIGKLSRRTAVNIETIRYYERAGLLPRPSRTEGRHRVYDEPDVIRLRFIRRSRELGFSLDDIRALLRLVDSGNSDCCSTKEITLRQLTDVRGKIASLKNLERALKIMTDACQPDNQSSCPIIDALSKSHEGGRPGNADEGKKARRPVAQSIAKGVRARNAMVMRTPVEK